VIQSLLPRGFLVSVLGWEVDMGSQLDHRSSLDASANPTATLTTIAAERSRDRSARCCTDSQLAHCSPPSHSMNHTSR
jgi:hypothetical protein